MSWIQKLKYDEKGLIAAVIQDYKSEEVLMVAYMNAEAVKKTVETNTTHFYSRSRNKLWMKGEESGNIQKVREILVDCDKDTLVLKIEQIGGAACHTGHRSCFHKVIEENEVRITEKPVFDPEEVYGK